MAQALVRKSRLRVKGLKVRGREKIKEAIAISIQNGNYTTREIGIDVGKDHSTISRYLAEMEREEKWGIKRDANGNIVISLQKQRIQEYQELDNEPFSKLPSIQKWITFLKSGRVPASRIRYHRNNITRRSADATPLVNGFVRKVTKYRHFYWDGLLKFASLEKAIKVVSDLS